MTDRQLVAALVCEKFVDARDAGAHAVDAALAQHWADVASTYDNYVSGGLGGSLVDMARSGVVDNVLQRVAASARDMAGLPAPAAATAADALARLDLASLGPTEFNFVLPARAGAGALAGGHFGLPAPATQLTYVVAPAPAASRPDALSRAFPPAACPRKPAAGGDSDDDHDGSDDDGGGYAAIAASARARTPNHVMDAPPADAWAAMSDDERRAVAPTLRVELRNAARHYASGEMRKYRFSLPAGSDARLRALLHRLGIHDKNANGRYAVPRTYPIAAMRAGVKAFFAADAAPGMRRDAPRSVEPRRVRPSAALAGCGAPKAGGGDNDDDDDDEDDGGEDDGGEEEDACTLPATSRDAKTSIFESFFAETRAALGIAEDAKVFLFAPADEIMRHEKHNIDELWRAMPAKARQDFVSAHVYVLGAPRDKKANAAGAKGFTLHNGARVHVYAGADAASAAAAATEPYVELADGTRVAARPMSMGKRVTVMPLSDVLA